VIEIHHAEIDVGPHAIGPVCQAGRKRMPGWGSREIAELQQLLHPAITPGAVRDFGLR